MGEPQKPEIQNSVSAEEISSHLNELSSVVNSSFFQLNALLSPLSFQENAKVGAGLATSAQFESILSTHVPESLQELMRTTTDSDCKLSKQLILESIDQVEIRNRLKEVSGGEVTGFASGFFDLLDEDADEKTALRRSFRLQAEISTETESTLSGEFSAGSNGQVAYAAVESEFDLSFMKFFKWILSSPVKEADASASSSTEEQETEEKTGLQELRYLGKQKSLLLFDRSLGRAEHSSAANMSLTGSTQEGERVSLQATQQTQTVVLSEGPRLSERRSSQSSLNNKRIESSSDFGVMALDSRAVEFNLSWSISSGSEKQVFSFKITSQLNGKDCGVKSEGNAAVSEVKTAVARLSTGLEF